MESYDTPEELKARRSGMARFAKLKAIQEEKNRSRAAATTSTTLPPAYNPWLSEKDAQKWEAQQYDYTAKYKAEFELSQEEEEELLGQQSREGDPPLVDTSRPTMDSEVEHKPQVTISSIIRRRKLARRRIANGEQIDHDSETETIVSNSSQTYTTNGATTIPLEPQSNQPATSRPAEVSPTPVGISPSICNEFELNSTILPPTEIVGGDYNSTISTAELRNTFFAGYKPSKSLPIFKQRQSIINSINSYSVIIIEGATGCGKTTQVPVYILEDAILERGCSRAPVIYVTQPRRIAARSIADRVCKEHSWKLGSIVGYQVGLEKMVDTQTVLVFCTAGVLLQKLIQEKSLANFTHIIIDEAHERDADTDLLLMMIRTLMRKEQPFFRLIIMSATMDSPKLKRYFTFKTKFGHQLVTSPATISIGQERAAANVQILYQDTFRRLFNINFEVPEFDEENPELYDSCLRAAVKIIVEIIPHLDTFNEKSKSTLVFLPGLAEISKLDRMLKASPNVNDNLDIIPLHSCLSTSDQVRVFEPTRPGCRKVILATNIAESSITVSDAGFIIDFCLTKTLMKDPLTRFPTLKLQWSTQDKSTQRAGRTGRCCAGKVFRMVSQKFYKAFPQFAMPELLTAPLELSVLRVKNFQMGEIQALFAVVLDPPPFNEIRTAVLELKQIGALSSTYQGKVSDVDGDLTELGRVISALPIDVHLSKLIVLAYIFDVLDESIVVAACLSTNRTVVRHLYERPLDAYETKMDWSKGSYSDLFVSLDIYNQYLELKDKGKNLNWLSNWCNRYQFDERKLQEVDALVSEIRSRLEGIEIKSPEQPNRMRNKNEDNLMLKVALCAAFYPNFFLTQKLDLIDVKKELCGLDPTKTVIMHNIPVNHVPLYKTQLLNRIAENVSSDVDFIADCSRALIVLRDETEMEQDTSSMAAIGVEGIIKPTRQVPRCIYTAVKYGDSGDYVQIREYNEQAAMGRIKFYQQQKEVIAQALGNKLMPSWMKILEERPADNGELIEAPEDEYADLVKKRYFVELDFDVEQDQIDQIELHELERQERTLGGELIDNGTFKPIYKTIKGPDSPIRMMFRSLLVKSRGFSVDIDPHSVNSILLDPDYDQDRRQMLVAAAVTQTKRGKVMARDTTLMPNIRGLPTLMALLFAQYYTLVYNDKLKCISGGVFGIGWDEKGDPIDRQYEVDLGFDIHLAPEDFELINKARRRISDLLKFTAIKDAGGPQGTLKYQLRDIILSLMRKRRFPIEELDISLIDFEQEGFSKEINTIPKSEEELMMPTLNSTLTNVVSIVDQTQKTRPFLPVMQMSKKYSQADLYTSIRANLNHLQALVAGTEPFTSEGARCLLCGSGTDCFYIHFTKVVDHITSAEHAAKLGEFEVFEKRVAGSSTSASVVG